MKHSSLYFRAGAVGALSLMVGLPVLADGSSPRGADRSGPAYQAITVEPQQRADFLSGHIVDEQGRPIVGALVDAFHWFPGSETRTDASGAFLLRNTDPKNAYLVAGEKIEVTFSAPGYTPRYIVVQPLGKMTSPVVLTRGTFIVGTVLDPSGSPVAKAKVRAVAGPFEGDGVVITDRPYSTTTDAKGHYKLFLPGDTYELFVLGHKGVSRTKKIGLTSGKSLEKNISLQPGATFRARVVDSLTGKPVSGFQLLSASDFAAVSDKNGVIDIRNMYSGPFQWEVKAPGIARWWSAQAMHPHERKSLEEDGSRFQRNFDSLNFDVTPKMPMVTIVAERGVRIRGRVLDPTGKPVSGATVAPALTGTGNSLTGDTRFSIRTNAKGEYNGLFPAGHTREWNLIAHDGDYDEWRRFANATSQPLKTTAGQVIENFTLTLNTPIAVLGRVLSKSGQPVPYAEVRTVQADNRGNRYYEPTTKTDEKGDFVLRFVAPGRHFVQVEPFWLNAKEAPEESTKVVEVKAGASVSVGTLTQVPIR